LSTGGASIPYADCSFPGSGAVWNGSVDFTCAANSVTRKIHTGTTRKAGDDVVVTIRTTDLDAYNGTPPTGSGTTATSGSIMINGIEFVAGSSSGLAMIDHTIYTPESLSISDGEVTGTVTSYHNLAQVTATSVVDVTFTSGCCLPTSGTIKTTFKGGATARSGFSGSPETLTFTGCGTANYSGPEASSGPVNLFYCM
jgi:hypothetical protein